MSHYSISFEAFHVCIFFPCYLSTKNNSVTKLSDIFYEEIIKSTAVSMSLQAKTVAFAG